MCLSLAMTNLRSDAPTTRRIVRAFIDFLNSVEPAPGVDNEGLEVAKDCLSEFFQLNQLSRSDHPEPNLLVDLFASHETSQQNEHKPGENRDSPTVSAGNSLDNDQASALKFQDDVAGSEASEIGVSRDELFGQFFAALEKNHFFRTTRGGNDEHVLLDRVTTLFHDAINEIQGSGNQTFDQRSLAEALKTLGNKAMQSNAYADAIERYTCAIALCENNAVYYCNGAAAFTQIGKYAEAIRDSLRSIEIDPTYSKAYSRLGFAYYSQGNYSDAINKGFKKALELDPNNDAVKENLKAAEQKLREQRERRRRNPGYRTQFPGGSMSQAGPPPFASVSFDSGSVPANLASMFMPSHAHQGQNSGNSAAEDSQGMPPLHGSMAFSMGIDPANIASMFTSMAPNAHQQPSSQSSSAEQNHGSETAPPPFPSMPFDPSAIPANLVDMFVNMTGHGENSQGQSRGHSDTNGSDGPEGTTNENISFNFGGGQGRNININLGDNQNPEELMGTLRAMMGMFSPGASQGDQPPGTGDGRSASN